MSTKSLVHRLLFNALLELRERGRESGDNVVFHLSDLLHNAALQMDGAETCEDYDGILEFIRARAREKGCQEWLDRQLSTLEKTAAER